jgi:hypothetical protein
MCSSRWNENWHGKPKYSKKAYPGATLSTTNPTWRGLGSNPGRRGGKPATNRLSYGTAFVCALQIGVMRHSPLYFKSHLSYRNCEQDFFGGAGVNPFQVRTTQKTAHSNIIGRGRRGLRFILSVFEALEPTIWNSQKSGPLFMSALPPKAVHTSMCVWIMYLTIIVNYIYLLNDAEVHVVCAEKPWSRYWNFRGALLCG